ncbi:MAG: HRDC domain-containing protein [Gammaproteobacteria bacterium]|nr:HRDC domain-containing protein [Gammaproteobacteria bacterium]
MSVQMIRDADELQAFCQKLDPAKAIAIDTEFIRQKTYYAIPAVIQIAQQQEHEMLSTCIDAPLIEDWSALQNSLQQSKYCLTHSPDQDFEIFDQLFTDWTFNIYDTQVAAALLGAQPQISYAQLMQNTLGLEIDKSQSRTDWLKRPLSAAQLDYAIADVIHLPKAWQLLSQDLEHKDRLDWFKTDCERQVERHKAQSPLQSAWNRVKGIKRLSDSDFARAASLAHWREQRAMQKDRPRRWILADDIILELAQSPERLKHMQQEHKVLQHNHDSIRPLLDSPLQEFEQFDTNVFSPLNDAEKKRFSRIKQYCRKHAEKLDIDPATLSNRKTLEKIARGLSDFLDADNWRHRVLQNYLQEHA